MALFAATAWDRGQRLNAQAAEIARLQESRQQLTGQRASVRENAELMAENVPFGSQNVPVDPLAADSATPIGPTNPWDAFYQIFYGTTIGNPYVTGTGLAAGGLVGAVLSAGALYYSGGTAVPAYGILAYSLDQLQAGVRTVWTGEVVSTLGASTLGAGVEYVTGSSTAGALAGFGYDVGGGFLTGSCLSQARYANAPRGSVIARADGVAGDLLPASSLNSRQSAIHAALSESGATATLRKRSVSMADLRAITRVTGDEYMAFTQHGRRFIIRGHGNEIRVSQGLADDLRAGLYGRSSGHTHPPGFSLNPSTFDRSFLPAGQNRSAIWGDGPTPRIFHRTPADDVLFEAEQRTQQWRRLFGQ